MGCLWRPFAFYVLFRICFGIHGRIISVPYKHFIIFVWLSEDAQRAPLLLINVVFVIVLLYGNDVGTANGRPLILSPLIYNEI